MFTKNEIKMLYEEDKQRVFLVTWSTDKKNTIPWVLVTVYWSPTALLFWYLLVSDWKSKMCILERSDWRLAYKTGGWIGRWSLNVLGFHTDKYYKHQTVKLNVFVTDPFKLWVKLGLRGCVACCLAPDLAWPPWPQSVAGYYLWDEGRVFRQIGARG